MPNIVVLIIQGPAYNIVIYYSFLIIHSSKVYNYNPATNDKAMCNSEKSNFYLMLINAHLQIGT